MVFVDLTDCNVERNDEITSSLLAWCIVREFTWRFKTVILFSLITVRTSGTTASLKMSLMRWWLRWNLAAATCFTEKPSSMSASNKYTRFTGLDQQTNSFYWPRSITCVWQQQTNKLYWPWSTNKLNLLSSFPHQCLTATNKLILHPFINHKQTPEGRNILHSALRYQMSVPNIQPQRHNHIIPLLYQQHTVLVLCWLNCDNPLFHRMWCWRRFLYTKHWKQVVSSGNITCLCFSFTVILLSFGHCGSYTVSFLFTFYTHTHTRAQFRKTNSRSPLASIRITDIDYQLVFETQLVLKLC